MRQTHDDLPTVPAGQRRARKSERFAGHQRAERLLRVQWLELRAFDGIFGRVFMNLQSHVQHHTAQHGQHHRYDPGCANQRQA